MVVYIILLIVGMLLCFLSLWVALNSSKVSGIVKVLFILGLICCAIGGFGMKKEAWNNGWWWLLG